MSRPDAAALLPAMFVPRTHPDGLDRLVLADHAKSHVQGVQRCRKARHLLAVVVRTEHGPWAAWRDGSWRIGYRVGVRGCDANGSAGWACAWADQLRVYGTEPVWCPCMRSGPTNIDIVALAGMR